jgi:hypothetical protein
MLLTPPPEVRQTIVDLLGPPGFPVQDGPADLRFDYPPEGRSFRNAKHSAVIIRPTNHSDSTPGDLVINSCCS